MFTNNECLLCAKTNKIIEEKENQLSLYQNNLFELKSKMMDTSNMINIYFNYKNEIEFLRKENENLKRKSEGSVSNINNKINYEILKNKYLKEIEKNKALDVARSQLSALVDELRGNQDINLKNEISKLKKEISEKERLINSQNLQIEKLKNPTNDTKGMVEDVDRSLNDSNAKKLFKENEYLNNKFRKYHMKYIKFKSKYKTLKSFTKFLLPENKLLLSHKTRRESLEEKPVERKISLSRKESLSKSIDLFDNENNYIFNDDAKIKIDDVTIISNEIVEKPKVKTNKRERKCEPKKNLKKKCKKKKLISIDEDLENEKSAEVEDPNKNIVSITRIHINPLKKEAIDIQSLIELEKKEFFLKFNDCITSINFENSDKIIFYINNTLDVNNTFQDKITKIIEIIIENSNKFELTKILFFLKVFIIHYKEINPILNFREFIISHYDSFKQEVYFKNESNNIKNELQLIYNWDKNDQDKLINEIRNGQNYVRLEYLISYLLAIFYTNLPIDNEFTKFLFELISSKQVLQLFRLLTLPYNGIVRMNLKYSEEIESFKSNLNKIYFLAYYKQIIVDEYILIFIITLIDQWIDTKDQSEFIINSLINRIDSLDEYVSLKSTDKFQFNSDIIFLHIYQIIYIAAKHMDLECIYKSIFERVLWNKFVESNEGSLKRVGIIYFISYLLTIFANKDKKFELEITKSLMSWIYAIFDPKYNSEVITFHDRIAALSGFIETDLIKLDPSVHQIIFKVIDSFNKDQNSIFPEDFYEKLKILNFIK